MAECEKPPLVVDDLIVTAAVRYSLGRVSYIVGHVIDAVRRNMHALSPATLETIARDIDRADQRGALGMDFDRRDWRALRDDIRARGDQPANPGAPT